MAAELSVPVRLERAFREHPDRVAISAANGIATYRELERMISGILVRLGPGAERVGIVTGDDLETYASILAILMAGAAYVPLNRKNPAERNRLIAESAGLRTVLVSRPDGVVDDLVPALPSGTAIVAVNGLTSERRIAAPAVDDRDLAYLFFTSGTTGAPKGVPVRHESLSAFMSAVLDEDSYGFTAEDRFLQMFELTFDLSVVSLLAPLSIGASVHVVPDKGIASLNIARILDRDAITVALMVPSVLSYLRRFLPQLALPALRHSLFCGEALLHELVVEWAACVPNARIRNVYGPTEATIFCTEYVWAPGDSARQSVNGIVPIGRPIGTTGVAIVDERGVAVATGEQGELCLTGPQVTSGYWRDSARTDQAFLRLAADGERLAYRTGDLAFVNGDGNLVYCGRADSQVQIDGHRVELGEVEHYAREFLTHESTAAVPVRTGDGRQEFVLFVVGADTAGLERYLRRKLPAYMLPKRIVAVEAFPLSLNGKIDRKALLAGLAEAK